MAAEHFGLDDEALRGVTRTALGAAFADAATRRQLLDRVGSAGSAPVGCAPSSALRGQEPTGTPTNRKRDMLFTSSKRVIAAGLASAAVAVAGCGSDD